MPAVSTATVLLDEWKRGDLSNFRTASGRLITIYDPLTTKPEVLCRAQTHSHPIAQVNNYFASANSSIGVISGTSVGARQVQRTSEQPRMEIPLAKPGACNENPVPCKTINLPVKCSGISRLAGLTDG